jgi:hypothetical protein
MRQKTSGARHNSSLIVCRFSPDFHLNTIEN